MQSIGPTHERETIIGWNDESDMAEVWTASLRVFKRLLKRLGRAYLVEDTQHHAKFVFPMTFIQLPKAKTARTLTDTQRQAASNRMAMVHSRHAGKRIETDARKDSKNV